MTKIDDFVKAHNLKLTCAAYSPPLQDDKNSHKWICTLSNEKHSFQFDFSMGKAYRVWSFHYHSGKYKGQIVRNGERAPYFQNPTTWEMENTAPAPPDLQTVLPCLASDCLSVEYDTGFENWANEYGYDTDSRAAEKIYNKVVDNARELRRIFGRGMGAFLELANEE